MIKKIILVTVLFAAVYYGFHWGRVARLSYLYLECASPSDKAVISNESLSKDERLKVSVKIFSCAKEKQGFFDRLFNVVPEAWAHLPPQ
jgi:hypothetical protein